MSNKRAVLYVRVSTDAQTVENQVRELRQVARRRGWDVVEVYSDAGISGAKGRNGRPGLDSMLKDASRRKFDIVMAWAIDRLGRSLSDLLDTIQHLEACGVDLYLDQQAIDTTTPMGKLVFQLTGAFAEFERTMIRQRIKAGLKRAVAQGVKLGRPKIDSATERKVRNELAKGVGNLKVARSLGIGTGTVHRISIELALLFCLCRRAFYAWPPVGGTFWFHASATHWRAAHVNWFTQRGWRKRYRHRYARACAPILPVGSGANSRDHAVDRTGGSDLGAVPHR